MCVCVCVFFFTFLYLRKCPNSNTTKVYREYVPFRHNLVAVQPLVFKYYKCFDYGLKMCVRVRVFLSEV